MTMPATLTRLDSRVQATREAGGGMTTSKTLDVIERLLIAADHPDIAKIARYGPGEGPWGPTVERSPAKRITGVKVTHQSTATASLWEAIWPGEQPAELPAVPPKPKQMRAPRLVILVTQLLDVAKPPQFQAWRAVTLPELGNPDTQAGLPFGVSIILADGKRALLRATATGPTLGDEPEDDPYPDYVIPEGVKTCLNGSSTAKTNPGPQPDALSAAR